jgi:formamidopyrimidine-DNA glycosylase
MPELPEVETVRRHMALHLPGQTVQQIHLRRNDLRFAIPVDAVRALTGRPLGAVHRRSKYLLLEAGDDLLLIHLGMSGRLFVQPVADAPWQNHEHWRAELDGPRGRQLLRYVDARRFGMLDVVPAAERDRHPLLAELGPEPLSDAFHPAWLVQRTRDRRTPIKGVLMDASEVVGIGNIYASETCFRAGVHPLRQAGQVSKAACARLVASAKAVLHDAIAAGGTTLQDFVGGDSAPGYFQQQLDVYDRAGEPCHRCGEPIAHAVLSNRATYFCPRCQR